MCTILALKDIELVPEALLNEPAALEDVDEVVGANVREVMFRRQRLIASKTGRVQRGRRLICTTGRCVLTREGPR